MDLLSIKNILLNTEPEDLSTVCSIDRWYNQICQDHTFWQEYFLKRDRLPPPQPPDNLQYYLDEYFYLNQANKYMDYLDYQQYFRRMDPAQDKGFLIYDLSTLNQNLLTNLKFNALSLETWKVFTQNIRQKLKTSREEGLLMEIRITPTEENNLFNLNLISEIDDLNNTIQISRNHLQVVLARLLLDKIVFLDPTTEEPIELPIIN